MNSTRSCFSCSVSFVSRIRLKAIKDDLVAKLPRTKRSGKVVTKDLQVEITSAFDTELLVPAA